VVTFTRLIFYFHIKYTYNMAACYDNVIGDVKALHV